MKRVWKRVIFGLAVLAVASALAAAFYPRPPLVETAAVSRGPLRVTVDEDGRTRIRERYIVSAPLMGRLERITLKAGDAVQARKGVVAAIQPTDPALLDPRAEAEAQARVRAAEATLARAEPVLAQAAAELEYAQQDLARLRQAAAASAGTTRELDEASLRERTRAAAARAAEFSRDVARYELDLAKAALISTRRPEAGGPAARFEIMSPVSGRVLRVIQESEGVVKPGDPLLELGDPRDLEAVVDVLSRDAVRINPGQRVLFEHWGGDRALEAVVRLVEPSGFTKISALGVEEQRVNVVIDFPRESPPPDSLGDAFRVDARIVVWETSDCLRIPLGALLRDGGEWAAYVIDQGRARIRRLHLDHRGEEAAEVLSGLSAGDIVIVHPGDRVRESARVRPSASPQ